MQLIFKREEDNLTVEIKDGTSTIPFDYVEMIKKILSDKKLEETIFQGDISEVEKEKVKEMVKKINSAIPKSVGVEIEGISNDEIKSDSSEEESNNEDLPF